MVKDKDSILQRYARVLKVLGNPLRLKIVTALMEKRCRVGKLTDCVNEKLPIISQQIAILRKEGLIEGDRDKNSIKYRIKDRFTKNLIQFVLKELNKENDY